MSNYKELTFQSNDPYPKIGISGKNPTYARWMLDNMGGANSEMSAISLYFYNNLLTQPEYENVAYVFHKIMIVEMHHLDIFGQLAFRLGANPRLWTQYRNRKAYWTPAYNRYPTDFGCLMRNSLEGEQNTIAKYQKQITLIDDCNITDQLKRIILDEEIHVEIYKQVIQDCSEFF